MDDNLRKQLQLVLNRQLERATETRFRITNYDEKTIVEMLMMFYQQEVVKRRVQFINDSITQQKIEKAAKWLTGN